MRLSLSETQLLAKSQSLQAFLDKHNYLADYWAFKSYRSERLPYLNLKATPVSYANAANLRYNSVLKNDEYVRTENINSYAQLNLSQKVAATGGTLYVQSDVSRIENFGANNYTQFAAKPFTMGYSQNLFGFNAMKWQKEIEPLRFAKAQKEYIESTEGMLLDVTRLFFDLLKAQTVVEMAMANKSNTAKALDIAARRFELGTVGKEELLDLKLAKNNADINHREASIALRASKEELLNYLMLPIETNLTAEIPLGQHVDSIGVAKVLELALTNNPLPLSIEQSLIESRRDLKEVQSNQRFQASMGLSFGINKTDGMLIYQNAQLTPVNGQIGNVYKPDFDQYQQLAVTINVPILDWGTGKGRVEMARSRQQVTEISAQKTRQRFEQAVVTTAMTFNLQKEKVAAAAVSDSLASDSYELTIERFNSGKADVLKLNASQQAKDNARLQYINAVAGYWIQYHTLRKLTLYDFETGADIKSDIE
jgi:outer membrane protein TolC